MYVDVEEIAGTQGTQEAGEITQTPEAELQEQPGASEPEITLDDSGELNIPDSFWEDVTPEDKTPEEKETPKTDYYTPEDFAKAYQSGQIDESKINPAIVDYYKSVAAIERQKQEAAEIQRKAQAQLPPPPQPPQSPPPPTWEQVMEAAKTLAATKYLGIKPEEFDEYDQKHQSARIMAVNEIREMAQAQVQAQAQAHQAQIQAQQVQQARIAGISNIYAEYRQKTPEFDEIGQKFFPEWRRNLTMQQHETVNYILGQGNEAQVRQLFDAVIADYKAYKAPKKPAGAPAPPEVISAGNAGNEAQGMADASKLGDMSPDEQAEWLIRNKFVV
jgi:hypothetical protein